MLHLQVEPRNLRSWQAPQVTCSILKTKGESRGGGEGDSDCSKGSERQRSQRGPRREAGGGETWTAELLLRCVIQQAQTQRVSGRA